MLEAHSLTEAQLYLRINPCSLCDPRGWRLRSFADQKDPGEELDRVFGQCPSCGNPWALDFHIDDTTSGEPAGEVPVINPSYEPSGLIDVGQWLTLSHLFQQEIPRQRDKHDARLLSLQAAQCLDEALKFYDDPENDLPPPEAFFTEASSTRFRQSPQLFSRSRILSQRRSLPHAVDR